MTSGTTATLGPVGETMTYPARMRRALVCACLVALAYLGFVRDGAAQSAVPAAAAGSAVTVGKADTGSCTVTLTVKNPRAGDDVGLVVDLAEFREQTVTSGTASLEFHVGSPLRPGSIVKARVNGTEVAKVTVAAGNVTAADPCRPEPPASPSAETSPLQATAYFGEVVDTFAPDSVGDYKNPEAGSAQKLRNVFGVDFAFRMLGKEESEVQLWLRGETLHGVRTADIDCTGTTPPPVCSDTTPFPARAKFILERASSIEALVSPRLEFKTLQLGSDAPARLYIVGNLGFIALERAPSVFKNFHLGTGLRTAAGTFEGSYLEVGFGRNQLFSGNRMRLKIDGLVSFNLDAVPLMGEAPRFFVEMFIDNNLRAGADSVQTFFGIDLDLKKAFAR